MSYTVKLDIFEGPLDLLFHLIKENRIDIYDIPIAKITEQYLEYLQIIRMLDLNIAGEFLIMAATLIHIKSKMLLPPEEQGIEEEEQDPRSELVQQLIEYKRFKEVAEHLHRLGDAQRGVFTRPVTGEGGQDNSDEESHPYFEANIFDLISAFSCLMKEIPQEVFYEVIKDEFTVDEKSRHILFLLSDRAQMNFGELFASAKNKLEIITIFLAILELVKMKDIIAVQDKPFGEIIIKRWSHHR